MEKNPTVEFGDEGVVIKLPTQGKKLGVRRQPLERLQDLPGVPDGFNPHRLVINFELFEEENPDVYLTEFEEPFELNVRYLFSDLQKAQKSGKELRLGFWDGSQWIYFTPEKHKFHLIPDKNEEKGGMGVAHITRWGDPMVAWGT